MAANGRGGMRPAHANRTPSFIFIGLLVVIGILGFNYWNVTTKNATVSRKLNDMTDRFRRMTVDKTTAESRFEELNKRLKESETEVVNQKTLVGNKDEELNSLTNQLNDGRQQLDAAVEEQQNCKSERDAALNKQIAFETAEAALRAEKEEKDGELQACVVDKAKIIESNQQECTQVGDAVRLKLLKTVQTLFGDAAITSLQQNGVSINGITVGNNPQGEVNLNQPEPQVQEQPPNDAGAQVQPPKQNAQPADGAAPQVDQAGVGAADQANPAVPAVDTKVEVPAEQPFLRSSGFMAPQPPARQEDGFGMQGQPPPMNAPELPNAGYLPAQNLAQRDGGYPQAPRDGGYPQAPRDGGYPQADPVVNRQWEATYQQQPGGRPGGEFGHGAGLNERPAGDIYHQAAHMNQDSPPGSQLVRDSRIVDAGVQPPQANQAVVSRGNENHPQGPEGVNQGEAPQGVNPLDSQHVGAMRDDQEDNKEALKYEGNKEGEAHPAVENL